MKILFCGTLPRFKEKREDYLKIRQTLLDAECQITRDWIQEEIEGKIKTTWPQRWELIREAIKQSDACILDCTLMDAYVGEQLAMIVEREMPLLLLVDGSVRDVQDSPLTEYFIGRDQMQFIQKKTYTKDTLSSVIHDFLEWVKTNKRIVRFNLEIEKNLDDYLKEKAKKNNTSKSEEIRKLVIEDMRH